MTKEIEDRQREIVRSAMKDHGGVMVPRLAGRWAWTIGLPRQAPSTAMADDWLAGWDAEADSGVDLSGFEERIMAEFGSYVLEETVDA